MAPPDWWWSPLGAEGELRVRHLVTDRAVHLRALRTEHVREVLLARFTLGGRDLAAHVGHGSYVVRDGEQDVVRFIVAGGRPWRAVLAGVELEMRDESVDLPRPGSHKVEQVQQLRIGGATGSWAVRFTGGRLAGERLVLDRGERPEAGRLPVVSCVPAPQTRDLPTARLRRRQPGDVDVVTWTADATPAEVALVELLVLSGRHASLDYLPATVAGAARQVAGVWRVFTPQPEPLPTRDGAR